METVARMKNVLVSALLLLGLCSPILRAQEASSQTYTLKDGSTLTYSKTGFWRTLAYGPSDFGLFMKQSFKKENLPWLAAITASTLVLLHYDQRIYTGSRVIGKKLNIASEDKTKTYLKGFGISLFRGPSDLGSAIYYIGDGWINIGLFGYFKTAGWLGKDLRASQTGNQLMEGLVVTGFTTQFLKRTTGRETPGAASKPRGRWQLFPSFSQFFNHRSHYDAFPSGHLATCMMTLTVIADNYPDKGYIKPVGYAMLGALSFQMMNNGVHWASDYPLGLAIGYGIGKAIAGGRTGAHRGAAAAPSALSLAPYLGPEGEPGAMLAYKF